ncbi:hypothetical protein Taro_013047, partial [Colocasia esculenta]|nr:hypothetical protein [Colocasia esculenta]
WEGVHLVRCTLYFCRPRVYADRVRLPDYAGCPSDMIRITLSSITYPISFSSRFLRESLFVTSGGGSSQGRPLSRAIIQRRRRWLSQLDANHAGFLGPMDSSKEFPLSVRDLLFDMFTRRYMFTREEDLPQARVVWESTTQTNFRKSLWEAGDMAVKVTGSQDLIDWMDYGPVWMRRDYWESLCHRWATEPWQERSQAAKRYRTAHLEKNVHTSGSVPYATHSQKLRHELERAPTFRELLDQTYKQKGTNDYVSESARTIT